MPWWASWDTSARPCYSSSCPRCSTSSTHCLNSCISSRALATVYPGSHLGLERDIIAFSLGMHKVSLINLLCKGSGPKEELTLSMWLALYKLQSTFTYIILFNVHSSSDRSTGGNFHIGPRTELLDPARDLPATFSPGWHQEAWSTFTVCPFPSWLRAPYLPVHALACCAPTSSTPFTSF